VLAGDRFGWYRLDVAAALAVLLAITGVGLVVGAFIGGGRGLIAPAAVLLVLTIAAAGVGRVHVNGAVGERTVRPVTIAEAEDGYDHGIGQLTVDLRGLDRADEDEVTISVDLGVGEVKVLVPEGTNLEVVTDVGIGKVDVLDREAEGVGNDDTFRFEDPASNQKLRLEIDVGIGHVDVDRVPAATGAR
jgi:hypothetical protein